MNEVPDEKIRAIFIEEKKRTVQLQNEMRRDFLNSRIRNLDRRQDFLKLIILISAGVLGLATLINKDIKEIIIFEYFIVSIFLYLAIILCSFSYLRSKLDKETTGLENVERELDLIPSKQKNIIDKYLKKEYLTAQSYFEYKKELLSIPGFKKLVKDKLDLGSQQKTNKRKGLDYFLELIIFLFSTASFFVLISFINIRLNIYVIILIIFSIFVFSFIDYTAYISKLFNFVRKNTMVSPKLFYIIATTFLGILISFIMHGLIEMLYLKILSDQGRSVNWTSYFGVKSCALPIYLQIGLLLAGVIGGFYLGIYWWKKVYEKK